MTLQIAAITGRVYGLGRRTVSQVVVSELDGQVRAVTNGNGTFSFATAEDCPPALVFSHPEYASAVVPIERADEVVLERGVDLHGSVHRESRSHDLALTLDLFREVVGRGAPMLHHCPSLRLGPGERDFDVPRLAAGRYIALLRGPERLQQLTRRFVVTAAAPLLHVVMYRFSVRITVTRNGAPLSSALLTLRPADDVVAGRVWHPSAVTDAAGEIHADLWQAGAVIASIEHADFDRAFRTSGVLDSQNPTWTIDVDVGTFDG